MSENKLGMKWFHFLIYFVLWFNAAILLLDGIVYVSGDAYLDNSSMIYTQYPALQMIDMIYGIAMILFAVFCVIARSRLAKFKKGAPTFLYAFYVLGNIVLPLGYALLSWVVAGYQSDILSTAIGSIVGTIVAVALNKVYFDKRAHLFVN